MDAIWAFLSNPEIQRTLTWLGGGLVIVAGGLWAVIQFFFRRPSSPTAAAPSTSISADRGSIAAGRDVKVTHPPPRTNATHGLSGLQTVLLVLVVVGGMFLTAAFAGTRITVIGGGYTGGDIRDSTINIQGSGRAAP